VRLARACLAADPSERPRDAGAVARAVSAHLTSAEERVKQAELAAALARSRASAERRARLMTSAAGVAVLLGVLIAGGGVLIAGGSYLLVERTKIRAERDRVARLQQTLALLATLDAKGNWLLDHARSAQARDSLKWAEALALTGEAVRQALALESNEPTRLRTLDRLEQIREAEAALRARAAAGR
jgi:hypothetical protein